MSDSFDILDLLILGHLSILDLSIQNIIILLLGVKQRLYLLHMIWRFSPYKRFQRLFYSIELAANLKNLNIFFFKLNSCIVTCLSMYFNFSSRLSISFYNFLFLLQNCYDRSYSSILGPLISGMVCMILPSIFTAVFGF